jgi:hypothetical protein
MARTRTLIGEGQGGLTRRSLLGAGTASLGGVLLARPGSALAATSPGRSGVPTPEGFRKFLVYIAEGKAGGIIDPQFVLAFQREVYGRDEAAVVAYSMDAKEFFLTRFGLDFRSASAATATGPWEIEGARLQGSVFSPANRYTASVVSEGWVGAAGWIVRDSSFNVTLTVSGTMSARAPRLTHCAGNDDRAHPPGRSSARRFSGGGLTVRALAPRPPPAGSTSTPAGRWSRSPTPNGWAGRSSKACPSPAEPPAAAADRHCAARRAKAV